MPQRYTTLLAEKLTPNWTYLDKFHKHDHLKKQKTAFDNHHQTHQLPTLPDDTKVWVNSGERTVRGRATVHTDSPCSYLVDTPTGIVRRNRSHVGIVHEQLFSATKQDQPLLPRKIMTQLQTHTEVHIRPPERYPDKPKTSEGRCQTI